jgi:CrcB protein
MSYLLVFIGGGLGSVVRFLLSRLIAHCNVQELWSTSIANFAACILVSLIIFLKVMYQMPFVQPLFIIGFCGGLSTFSTWTFDNYQLLTQGFYGLFICNILLSIGMGLLPFFFFQRLS